MMVNEPRQQRDVAYSDRCKLDDYQLFGQLISVVVVVVVVVVPVSVAGSLGGGIGMIA